MLTFSYLALPVSPPLLLCLPVAFIAVIQIKTSSISLPACLPVLLRADMLIILYFTYFTIILKIAALAILMLLFDILIFNVKKYLVAY